MDAAGFTRLDGFGVSTARKLEFGHVGHWQAVRDGDTAGSVAVEIDPGDGSSVVVFVRTPHRLDSSADFHPDDQVCLVIPDLIAELFAPG
ncbi:hypothetical protein [Nocardia bovistercoris]|uniref:Uncharacterized protein n=1 Tax=Nocardia bovistercoris TaxID=2785916 RepID=A0A931N440_9NOCA|nr:hypothetical protein [Nocardia bovistercoris]MBH0781325.1 hypothetical protein [Nocardia bovistercoris]